MSFSAPDLFKKLAADSAESAVHQTTKHTISHILKQSVGYIPLQKHIFRLKFNIFSFCVSLRFQTFYGDLLTSFKHDIAFYTTGPKVANVF